MIATYVIALREYIEAFLIIGIFLGISKKLSLKKEKEIILASFIGIIISIALPLFFFYFNNLTSVILTKKNSEIVEGWILIFSSFFISYVVFSLHKLIHQLTNKSGMKYFSEKRSGFFDISLFILIIFFVLREGFEIALFTATTSILYSFLENLIGLFLAFFSASILCFLVYFSFLKISIKKIYKITEWLIIFLGAAMITNGINEILEGYFNLKLSYFFPIKLFFLPEPSTFLGHFLKNLFGVQRDFSLVSLFIIISYILTIKKIFSIKN